MQDQKTISLKKISKPAGHWNHETSSDDALKYTTKTEWRKNSYGAYNASRKNGWLDECCAHMKIVSKPNGYWTKELCVKDALDYTTKTEWDKKSSSAYQIAHKNGWLDECCAHMSGNEKWTLERCKKTSSKYSKRSDWKLNDNLSYAAAQKNNWLNECCKHMQEIKKPNGYWTEEVCKKDALKYSTVQDWRNNSSGYSTAHTNNWLDDCCKHMEEIKKPNGYWSLDSCKDDALKHKTKSGWAEKSTSAYSTAHKNDWLDECCAHMVNGTSFNFYLRKKYNLDYLKEIRSDLSTLAVSQIFIMLSGSDELNKILKIDGIADALSLPVIEREKKINEIIVREEEKIASYNPEDNIDTCDETPETNDEEETTSSTIEQILIQANKNDSESIIIDTTVSSLANLIKQLDKQVHNKMSDESIEALVSIETNNLLNGILNKTITVEEIKNALSAPSTNEIAKKVTKFVKEKFLEDYNKAMSLELKWYKGKNVPTVMQRVMAYTALSTKCFFNFSLGGVGKTIAAIITSRTIESKMTIVVCLNSTVDQWKTEIISCYPDSKVFLKNQINKIKNDDSSKYLILNYESFQGQEGKKLALHLIKNLNIDFILLDEIHKAKQREEDKFSNRKDTITNLITSFKQKNENLRVVGMTATPILNNLTEFKYLLEMVMSENYSKNSDDIQNPYLALKTKFNIANSFEMHKHVARSSIRCKLNLPAKFEQKIITRTSDDLANQILTLNSNGSVKKIASGLEYEQIVLPEKLVLIENQIVKGTIIYSHYVEGIIDSIKKFVESKGFSVGLYTGDDKSGLNKFKAGKYDILVASSAIGTGVDGVQKISNRIIATCLPWTHGELLQLIWRIYRQGSIFENVDLIIPQIYFTYLGEEYSVDKFKLGNINLKKNKSDAAIDGEIARISAQEEQKLIGLCVEKLNAIFKSHENSIYTIFREKLPINLADFTFEKFEKLRSELGEISKMHKAWRNISSEKLNKIFKDNPEKFFYYHSIRGIKKKLEDPLMTIAKILEPRPDWIIADFGCGENRLKDEIKNKIYAFDHVAFDETVMACDVSHVPLEDCSVDVVVCCLSLWGSNWDKQIKEANRILKPYGRIFIAETLNKWKDKEIEFKARVESFGFQCFEKNTDKFIYLSGEKVKFDFL